MAQWVETGEGENSSDTGDLELPTRIALLPFNHHVP